MSPELSKRACAPASRSRVSEEVTRRTVVFADTPLIPTHCSGGRHSNESRFLALCLRRLRIISPPRGRGRGSDREKVFPQAASQCPSEMSLGTGKAATTMQTRVIAVCSRLIDFA